MINKTDYELLVNRENNIDEDYLNDVIIPSLVEVNHIKNNDTAFRVFKIKDKKIRLEKETAKHFNELRNYAKENGIIYDISSGYLSLMQQSIKYAWFLERKGFEFTNKTACLPGFSEHNTGLCLDGDIFKDEKWGAVSPDENGNINEETQWIHTILHKFGFILRYPKGKEEITKLKFESWHIRYVGEKTAKYIYENNLTLEEYHENKNIADKKP